MPPVFVYCYCQCWQHVYTTLQFNLASLISQKTDPATYCRIPNALTPR